MMNGGHARGEIMKEIINENLRNIERELESTAIILSEIKSKLDVGFRPEEVYRFFEGTYIHTARALLDIQECITETYESLEPEEKKHERISFLSERAIVDFTHLGGVHITIDTPPMTKKRASKILFWQLYCKDIEAKIVEKKPWDFKMIQSAYVIYLSHFDKSNPSKQPYFDNDNLAIKALLDAVLPHVCPDDAAVFCSNLYLTQSDQTQFTELFVVPKCHFNQWISENKSLEFCKDIVGFL